MNYSRVLRGQSCPELNQRQNRDFLNLKNLFLPDVSSYRPENFFLLRILSKDHRFSTESANSISNLRSRSQFALRWTIVELDFETNSFENELGIWCSSKFSCLPDTPFRAEFLRIGGILRFQGSANEHQITKHAMFENPLQNFPLQVFKDFVFKVRYKSIGLDSGSWRFPWVTIRFLPLSYINFMCLERVPIFSWP